MHNGELAKMYQVSPSTRKECRKKLGLMYLQTVTELRIGQMGDGLGPRAFGGPAQIFPMTTQCQLKICKTAQRYNFTI